MKYDLFIKDYLAKYKSEKVNQSVQDSYLLLGSLQLYLATGDIEYKKIITEYVDCVNDLNDIAIGKVLFYLYEETKEDRYMQAIEELISKMKTGPKDLEEFYMIMPIYAEYGTKIGKKENYNDIITQFKNIRNNIKSDTEKEWYLMALIDTLEVMSEEIFEHYKALEVFTKEAVKEIENDSAVRAYGILKSCRLKALLKEKYQENGIKIFESIGDIGNNVMEATPDNNKSIGMLMMAYAQVLFLGKEE
ncbi:MAG: hypothetical protein GX913_05420 [Clostridiales bacterium]|nr:hypothetical protein [Clostridiales bacterium]